MNLPTRHPYDSVQDFKRQDFNALYSIQPTQLTCLLHTLTATTIDKISHFHQIHSLHNFIHQHDHFEKEDLHNHNEKRSLIFSTFITKVKLKQQKAPRVNILAKTSNFFPLLKQKHANFFPVFFYQHQYKSSWHLSNGAKRRKSFTILPEIVQKKVEIDN